MKEINNYKNILISKELKITPQRLAVLDALYNLHMHPTADIIIDYIENHHPSIAVGTVYRTLETFVEKGIVNKVKTEKDSMRYDAVLKKHHHLYCIDSEKIEDFYDDELDNLLNAYFRKKNIPGFDIKDIRIQIIGNFHDKENLHDQNH